MIIFPAIDIRNGKCVRLIQGDYNQEKIYGDSPVDTAKSWEQKGAEYLHIVDLDGAKTGDSLNRETIKIIAREISIPLQVGGGIRSLDIIDDYLSNGVDRVIIGTAAINDKEFLKTAVSKYGDQIAVSIDARGGYVATDGWTDTSNILALDLIKELEEIGVKTIVYTDILKDGMLQGPNLTEQQTINASTPINVIASGGVSSKQDVKDLQALDLYGTIIGKALYDGALSFESVINGGKIMTKKRIIPCLDIDKGRVVKGQKFENVQDVDDPVTLAKKYDLDNADELFMLDITADEREKFLEIVKKVAAEISIPLTVGGGIRTLEDIEQVLNAGADKISITSAAIVNPVLLKDAVQKYGGERIVLAIDAKKVAEGKWHAFENGGRKDSGLDAIEWAKQGEHFGIGEILVNSIDADGVKEGYDIALNQAIAEAVNIPIIASGGAGEFDHFATVLTEGKANAALAASVFHYDEIMIPDLKEYLLNFDIPVGEI